MAYNYLISLKTIALMTAPSSKKKKKPAECAAEWQCAEQLEWWMKPVWDVVSAGHAENKYQGWEWGH